MPTQPRTTPKLNSGDHMLITEDAAAQPGLRPLRRRKRSFLRRIRLGPDAIGGRVWICSFFTS